MFQNFLSNIFKPASATSTTQAYTPPNPNFGQNFGATPAANPYYQIKEDDTDLVNVAGNLGVPPQQLIDANDGDKTLPPKGSFISTQTLAQQQAAAYGNLATPGTGSFISGAGNVLGASTVSPTGSFTAPAGGANLAELNLNIQQQVAAGNMPSTVSFYTPIVNPTTGLPVSQQEMIANGYVYDNIKKEWRLPGVGAPSSDVTAGGQPASGNNWMTNPALHIVRFGRGRNSFETTEKWARGARKRQRGVGYRQRHGWQQVEVMPAEGANTGAAPTSVLNLQIGSG